MLAALAMLCGFTLVGAAPAQAAITVDLNVSATTITEGDTITLSWTSTEASQLWAYLDWDGYKGTSSGSQDLTVYGAGTKSYMLAARDANGQQVAQDTVTVTVLPAPITPAPVTFAGCVVTVPATPNVTYFVDRGDDDIQELDADTYPASYFFAGGDPVTFFAEVADGFTFDDKAVTEWDFTPSEECLGETFLLSVTATCGKVTFTNITDPGLSLIVSVMYGSFNESQPDGEFDLQPGAARTITTDRDHIDYVARAGEGGQDGEQESGIDVPTCDPADGSDHPTVAPAAGR
ncbi:hypothetical protein [Aeromicrobium panaciterrae]|uniref:hypothetical protein n=1 Tax=Aeromicrobium panaciterrae TaxID=363861 RepID=UPI0031E32671